MKHVAFALLVAVAIAGCKEDKSDEKSTGVKECDEYIAAMEACAAKLDGPAKKPMEDSVRAQRSALQGAGDAQKKQAVDGCVTGLAALKQNPACK